MAILHQATLKPSKLEMIAEHLESAGFLAGDTGTELTLLGSYRFDDPAGAVGIETHLVGNGSGPTFHLPLTYRAEPLIGAEAWLLGTMEHSVLGRRWVYNGCDDPVYVAELVRVMLTGGSQVEQFVDTENGMVLREPTALVSGSGTPHTPVPVIDDVTATREGMTTSIRAAALEIVVRHVIDESAPPTTGAALAGTWTGVENPKVLAFIR